jgi:4-carboxymuconolactone decarboxylase
MSETGSGSDRHQRAADLLAQIGGPTPEEIIETHGELGPLIVEFVFGEVLARPGLSVRDRELATVSMLAALNGKERQIDSHLRLALASGVELAELKEIAIQAAVYGGFPAGINAMARVRELEKQQSGSGQDGERNGQS